MQTQFLTYTLSQKLGEGGMATVWYAENSLGKRFAIKVLKPGMEVKEKLAERFRLEAKMMVSLEHPNIRQVIDYYEDDSSMAIIMEYLEGKDLGRYLIEHGPVSESLAIQWFTDILDAVAYVHQKQYIHRDIKPTNLFLTSNGRLKVMDFGIAKIVNANLELTETNTNIGSPQYMSPEQIKTPKNIDHRTDIYSLGVTLYALLTGKKPYDDSYGSAYMVQEEIVKKNLPLIPGVSERTNHVIQKATAKLPADRFQSCGEMKEALTGIKPTIVEIDDEKTRILTPNLPKLPPDVRKEAENRPVEEKKKKTDDAKNGEVKKSKTLRNVLISFFILVVLGATLFWLWMQYIKSEISKGIELAQKAEYTEAFNLLYRHRESNYMTPEAFHELGRMYNMGNGTEQNYIQAFNWYLKAANEGYLRSLNNIGLLYENGNGVDLDYEKARKCYQTAAINGLAKAKYNMGHLYAYGHGVSPNAYEAFRWYKEGAEGGDDAAQLQAGLSYQSGTGVGKDYSQAEYWLRKAANQSNSDAQNSLGALYYKGYIGSNGVDYATARFWYLKAAEQNNVYSLHNLGYMHDHGEGVTQNWTIAVEYYKRAARLGSPEAQKRLNQYSIRW